MADLTRILLRGASPPGSLASPPWASGPCGCRCANPTSPGPPTTRNCRSEPAHVGRKRLWFLVPGDLDTPTGGYRYDRRIMAGLADLGWHVEHRPLDGSFPAPTSAALGQAEAVLASIPDQALVVVDGLGLRRTPRAGAGAAGPAAVGGPGAPPAGRRDGAADRTGRGAPRYRDPSPGPDPPDPGHQQGHRPPALGLIACRTGASGSRARYRPGAGGPGVAG